MENNKKLNLFSGVSYAIGSIIGSGILFLPSLTSKVSETNVLLSWGIATILCIPLLIIFHEMSQKISGNDGIKGFIELGLGKSWSSIFPVLMLSTVVIGMPSSAIIVGKFARNYFSLPGLEYVTAFYLLGFGIVSNLLSKSIGEKIQNIVSIVFFATAIFVFTLTFPQALPKYSSLVPDFNLMQTFSGITLAFWAFAGFENLTFIAHEFKNPKRDFILSMIIALALCGMIYLGITANYAAIIDRSSIQPVMGIFQLSQVVEPQWLSGLFVVLVAVFALNVNFNSWVKGLSSMIKISASSSDLPSCLKQGDRSTYFLAVLFIISLVTLSFIPSLLEKGLVIVSSNFLVIYVLCIISFLRIKSSMLKKIMASVTLIFIGSSLFSSKELLLYPAIIISVTYLYSRNRINIMKIVPIILIFTSFDTFSAKQKSIDVALLFRFDDKFNGSIEYLSKGLELAKKTYESEHNLKINYKRYSHDETLTSVIDAAKKAVAEGSYVIIGGENSDEALAIYEVIKDREIVLITPTATNPEVTRNKPYVFRTCISDEIVGEKIAVFLYENMKPKVIGVLKNISYPYSNYLSEKLTEKLKQLHSNKKSPIKILERKIIKNQKDFSSEVAFFKKEGVTDLVVLSYQSDLFRFYSHASEINFYPNYFGSDGWGTNESVYKRLVQDQKGKSHFKAYRNVYWNENNKSKSNQIFRKKFNDTYHESPNSWAAISYDTAKILFDSFLSIQGISSGKKLKNSLKSYKGDDLVTTKVLTFDQNNTPQKEVIIYKIDHQGIMYNGTI
jgi:amino acid efflux transporter